MPGLRSVWFAGFLAACGCAHGEGLHVALQERPRQGWDERVDLRAIPGGFAADVQFRRYGGSPGRVRVAAVVVTDGKAELRIRYRVDRRKCVHVRGYAVEVTGLPPGPHEVVVKRNDHTIGTGSVDVTKAVAMPARAEVRVRARGC